MGCPSSIEMPVFGVVLRLLSRNTGPRRLLDQQRLWQGQMYVGSALPPKQE